MTWRPALLTLHRTHAPLVSSRSAAPVPLSPRLLHHAELWCPERVLSPQAFCGDRMLAIRLQAAPADDSILLLAALLLPLSIMLATAVAEATAMMALALMLALALAAAVMMTLVALVLVLMMTLALARELVVVMMITLALALALMLALALASRPLSAPLLGAWPPRPQGLSASAALRLRATQRPALTLRAFSCACLARAALGMRACSNSRGVAPSRPPLPR